MSASFCCDRCGAVIPGNRSVLAATRGELAVEVLDDVALVDGFDLCRDCVAMLLDWLRSGKHHQAMPGATVNTPAGLLEVKAG